MRPVAEQQAETLAKARGITLEQAAALLAKALKSSKTSSGGTGTGH